MALTAPRSLLVLLLASACGSASTAAPSPEASPSGPTVVVQSAATTWTDGMVLRGTVTVPAGSTVTLAPGAALTAVKGAHLVVAGSLLAPAGATLSGKEWEGVTVARGGNVALSGVTVSGAENGLVTEEGALPSTFSGTLRDVHYPFTVGTGTTLTSTGLDVRDVTGASEVKGTLVASKLSYDKAGNAGMVVSGSVRITDSVLYGNGDFDGDFLTTDEADEVTVTRTEIRDVHCAFHLVGVDRLTLTGLDIHDNAYGFMAYGSSPTQVHRITDTDVYDNRDFGLQETPGVEQGRIVVDGGYWGDNGSSPAATITQASGKVERVNPQASRS